MVSCSKQGGPVGEAISHKDDYQQAYVYGFPMIAGYKAMYQFAIDKSNSQYKAPFNQIYADLREPDQPLPDQLADAVEHEKERRRITDPLHPEGRACGAQESQLAARCRWHDLHGDEPLLAEGTASKVDSAPGRWDMAATSRHGGAINHETGAVGEICPTLVSPAALVKSRFWKERGHP
jgi:hypothetical protein